MALLDRYTPLTPPPSDRSLLLINEPLTPLTAQHMARSVTLRVCVQLREENSVMH